MRWPNAGSARTRIRATEGHRPAALVSTEALAFPLRLTDALAPLTDPAALRRCLCEALRAPHFRA